MKKDKIENVRGGHNEYLKDISTIIREKDSNSILVEVIPSIDGENEFKNGTQITVNFNSDDTIDKLEISDEVIIQYLLIEKDVKSNLSVEIKSPCNIIKNGEELIQY